MHGPILYCVMAGRIPVDYIYVWSGDDPLVAFLQARPECQGRDLRIVECEDDPGEDPAWPGSLAESYEEEVGVIIGVGSYLDD